MRMIARQKSRNAFSVYGAAGLAVAAALHATPALAQDPAAESVAPSVAPVVPSGTGLPQVDPVIGDEEFARAVPDLSPQDDPELNRELESIAEFERRIAEQQGASSGDHPPGGPALADGDAAEEIGDAALRDAELARPLSPIETFDVAPVDFAEASAGNESASVPYRVEVTGLDQVGKETSASMLGAFNALSVLKEADGQAANTSMIQARLAEDSALMQTILASEGWYSAGVETRIEMPTVEGGRTGQMVAVLDVDPGRRYSFGKIGIDASPTVPPDLIADNLALKVGEPIVAERVQGAEAQIAVALPQAGYPFAEVKERTILLDRETGKGDYLLPVVPGPRARFGGFATGGDLAFDAEHIDVLARFDRGELYDSRKVDDLRKALVATGLFSTVSVVPRRTGECAGDDTEYVTVHVEQDAGPPRTIAGTVGYGTGEGFRAEATWTHRNIFPPEGALIVHGVAGTKEQGAGVIFRRANAGQRDRTFEIVAEGLHSAYDAYSAYTGRLAVQMRRTSTPIWQKRFAYAVGAEFLATSERTFDFRLRRDDRKTYYVAGLNGQLGIDFSDDLLDPTKGFRATFLVQPEGSLRDGFDFYIKSQLDASGYFPVGERIVLAGRVRLGSIQGTARDNIAPSRRFYAGGGGSVRGFAYQRLGPLDPLGDPVGGRSVNEASAEARYRFGTFGIVAFADVGQAYASRLPHFGDLRYGAGIGARYYTNFGPLRVDLATPLDRRPGEGRFNLYVSIGQAF